jgi:hypothetical protein
MNKNKLKRREEKEENNKKKRSKSYTKKEKPKQLGRIVAPVHFDPKILPKGSAKLRWVGPSLGQKGSNLFLEIDIFGGCIRSSEAAMGEGRAAPRLAC